MPNVMVKEREQKCVGLLGSFAKEGPDSAGGVGRLLLTQPFIDPSPLHADSMAGALLAVFSNEGTLRMEATCWQ